MQYIEMNQALIDVFFGGLDSDSLEEVRSLVEKGAVLNPLSGELFLNNTRSGIFTDYFGLAFYLDEDEKPYQVGSEKLVIASRKNPYGYDYQYICIEQNPMGSDGWDSAMAWDPNSQECYGADCRVYQLQIEIAEDEWEEFPIWFDNREDATIFLNKD